MTATTTIQATQVLWDKTADKLYVWDTATKAWELFFVAADLVTNDALTADLALKVSIAGDTMSGALELPNIGIGTAPDATNKISAVTNAALFADLGTGAGGTGDIRAILSKQASGNTASFLFQDDFSGRAEIGLCGDDNFHFKVSPDGSTFFDGIVLDKSSGQATLLTAPKITGMTAGSIPFFGASGLLSQDNAALFWNDTNKFLGINTATPSQPLDVFVGTSTEFTLGSGGFSTTCTTNAGGTFGINRSGGTLASPAVIATGTTCGRFIFRGYNAGGLGGGFQSVAQFNANCIEPTPSATAMGGQLIFEATQLGTTSTVEVGRFEVATGLSMFGANPVIDGSRIFRPRSYTCAALPSVTSTGIIHVSDDGGGNTLAYCDGANWRRVADDQIISTGNVAGQVAAMLGVNAIPDSTNKLSVASSAILFNNIGSDCRIFLNKATSGNTASTLYEDGFSGRAEVGLCGDDNFHFKVSPDGSSFTDALILDKTSGQATFANALAFSPPSSVTPANNGQVMFEATSNTSFKIKFKGSDGVVRSATLTLS